MQDPRFTVNRNLGKFIDMDGNLMDAPPPDDERLVIVAGFWEDMPKSAMQEKCRVCKRLVGVDLNSQNFLTQPGKVSSVMCVDCWEGLQMFRFQGLDGLSKWLDGMEKRREDRGGPSR